MYGRLMALNKLAISSPSSCHSTLAPSHLMQYVFVSTITTVVSARVFPFPLFGEMSEMPTCQRSRIRHLLTFHSSTNSLYKIAFVDFLQTVSVDFTLSKINQYHNMIGFFRIRRMLFVLLIFHNLQRLPINQI